MHDDPMIAQWLVAASAAILFLLGALHLKLTFTGRKLHPRDPALIERMQAETLVMRKDINLWKAWIGFNASHSMGAMLFGAIYAYLAIAQPTLLFGSVFLACVGLLMLTGFLALGYRYWFSIPFRSTAVALLCYVAGFAFVIS